MTIHEGPESRFESIPTVKMGDSFTLFRSLDMPKLDLNEAYNSKSITVVMTDSIRVSTETARPFSVDFDLIIANKAIMNEALIRAKQTSSTETILIRGNECVITLSGNRSLETPLKDYGDVMPRVIKTNEEGEKVESVGLAFRANFAPNTDIEREFLSEAEFLTKIGDHWYFLKNDPDLALPEGPTLLEKASRVGATRDEKLVLLPYTEAIQTEFTATLIKR